MKNLLFILIAVCLLSVARASSQSYRIRQSVTGSGGTLSTSASYTMRNTFGQPAIGQNSSSGYSLHGNGFWYEYNSLKTSRHGTFAVADGWNMVSVPLTVPDNRKDIVYPSAVSQAFSYDGQYRTGDTLHNGIGYWLKFSGAQSIIVDGIPRSRDTIAVADKWNMIGSIGVPVPTGSIVQIPPDIVVSQYFGYDQTYYVAGEIEPGKAYWVKTNGGGKLVLSDAGIPAPSVTQSSVADELDALNAITVEQISSDGKSISRPQELFFGQSGSKNIQIDHYAMPPTPPAGSLDIRFESGRYVELIPTDVEEPKQIPLQIHSTGAPLKLSWKMSEESNLKYVLLEKKSQKIVSNHRMKGSGAITIDAADGKSWALQAEHVPVAFALHQNYPNPFNPSTTIRYDLPERSHVRLMVYDILGQEVRVLADEIQEEGSKTVEWSTQGGDARTLASGVYFYRLTASQTAGKTAVEKDDRQTSNPSGGPARSFTEVKKMLLVR